MKKFIKKIQNKPEHTRKQILFASTLVIGGLIVFFWIFTLQYRFSSIDSAKVREELKPLSIIKENITDTYNDVSMRIKSVKVDSISSQPSQNAVAGTAPQTE